MTTMKPKELTARREQAGLTMKQLADALGVNNATVWRWEAGKTRIPRIVELALDKILRERGT
jgi:transcriptional regulator with XRE-family HTH domain